MINQETLDGLLFERVQHMPHPNAVRKEKFTPYVYDETNQYHVYRPVFLRYRGSKTDIQMLLAPLLPGAPFGELSPAASKARMRVLEKLIEKALDFDQEGVEYTLICSGHRLRFNEYAVSLRLHKPIKPEQPSFSAFVHLMFVIN